LTHIIINCLIDQTIFVYPGYMRMPEHISVHYIPIDNTAWPMIFSVTPAAIL
jgi:hypothetical protein